MFISLDFALLAQLAFSLCVIVILEGIAVYTWQFRAERGARWHIAVHVTKCLWLGALVVSTLGADRCLGTAGDRATWFLSIFSAYIWYRFFAEIGGFDRSAPRWLEPAIRMGTLFCWLLYLTNPWHHLIAFEVNRGGVFEEHYGPLCLYFTYPFGYAVNLLAVGMNVRWARGCRGLRRRQAWAFLVPNLLVWAGQFLSNMSWANQFDPHALFFLLSGVATAWAFFRWRSYSVLPRAQEAMLRNMIDGLVVVDEDGYIVRMNAAARSILPGAKEGLRFRRVASACPELLSLPDSAPKALEVSWEITGCKRFFQAQTTPLATSTGWLLGHVFCLKEITVEKAQLARIVEQQRAISLLQERSRIGRELHDGQGQSWSYVSMQLCAIEKWMAQGKTARAGELLKELRGEVENTHLDLRETITALHIGGDTLKHGFLHAIEEQLNWYRAHCRWQTRIELDCDWREEMLTPQSKVQLLRIVQEALANVRKHASAKSVLVTVGCTDGTLHIAVKDDGHGFDSGFDSDGAAGRSGHHGLRMMRERADDVGAELRVESHLGAGTSITALVPLQTLQRSFR